MTQFQEIGDLPLQLGGVLRGARLAYITRGRLAPDGRNAVLLTHGYTSSHTFIGAAPARRRAAGRTWSGRAERSTPTASSS